MGSGEAREGATTEMGGTEEEEEGSDDREDEKWRTETERTMSRGRWGTDSD
jgi:hypothetical protein